MNLKKFYQVLVVGGGLTFVAACGTTDNTGTSGSSTGTAASATGTSGSTGGSGTTTGPAGSSAGTSAGSTTGDNCTSWGSSY
jgi:hypothetical protein